jgi:hypothetical protein
MAAHTRTAKLICRSTPLSNSGTKSYYKPPPVKLARMVQPGIEENRSCYDVESKVGKDLLMVANAFFEYSHFTNNL